jgi:hypothetical protein
LVPHPVNEQRTHLAGLAGLGLCLEALRLLLLVLGAVLEQQLEQRLSLVLVLQVGG